MAEQDEEQVGTTRKLLTKQKIIVILLILIVLFIIYEVYGLMSGDSNADEITPVAVQSKPATPLPVASTNGSAPQSAPSAGMPPATPPVVVQQPQLIQPTKEQMAANAELLKKQQHDQEMYLQEVNNLQRLKIEREIVETAQAIATAKLAIDKAESERNQLAHAPLVPVSGSDYANKLVMPAQGMPLLPPGVAPAAAPPAPPQDVNYVVISVSMQLGRWMAVLGYQGKLYNVGVGDVLPTDGSVVMSITRDGVVLKHGDNTKRISLVPMV